MKFLCKIWLKTPVFNLIFHNRWVKVAEAVGIVVFVCKSESPKLSSDVAAASNVYTLARFSGLVPGLYMLTFPLECILIPSETVSLSKSYTE